nr:MAG TPA: hypothetical protein [Caudoviricetes sp.]
MTKDELMELTNDKKRGAVLESWESWPVLYDFPKIGLTVRKLELPDGSYFTAAWFAGNDVWTKSGKWAEPNEPGARNLNRPRFEYYNGEKPFRLRHSTKSETELKEILKKMREAMK